jgi:hypothetical protein
MNNAIVSNEGTRKKAKRSQGGYFPIPRSLYESEAWKEIAKKPSHVLVLLEAMSQLRFQKTKKHRRKMNGGLQLDGPGTVYLTRSQLKERGIRGTDTQKIARERLVELGFLDVVETGSYPNHPTVFRYSNRWTKFPDGPYQTAKDAKPIGKQKYARKALREGDLKKRERRSQEKKEDENKTLVQNSDLCRNLQVQELDLQVGVLH